MTFLEYMLIPFIMEASIKSLESFRFSIELLYATVSKNRNRLSSRTDMNSTRSQMNQMKQSSLLLKVQLVRLVMLVKIKVKKVGLNLFFFKTPSPKFLPKFMRLCPQDIQWSDPNKHPGPEVSVLNGISRPLVPRPWLNPVFLIVFYISFKSWRKKKRIKKTFT